MSFTQYFQSIAERLHSSANVRTIYGDPISLEGKTVIPVARIGYGFGAGGGSGRKPGQEETSGEGGGGGGGVQAVPVGVVEVTPSDTRFIVFSDKRKLAAIFAAGFFAGVVFGRRTFKS